jgi:hypothetical protein
MSLWGCINYVMNAAQLYALTSYLGTADRSYSYKYLEDIKRPMVMSHWPFDMSESDSVKLIGCLSQFCGVF